MKQSIFEVLMYLFENYMNDDIELDVDEESLRTELQDAGFAHGQISKAFVWLEGLASLQDEADYVPIDTASIRIYTPEECEKLDADSRGLLLFLEQTGVLEHGTREMVIDRVMALESEEVDPEQLKWVILMVLFNQPGYEGHYAWMEDLVFAEATGMLN